MSQILFCPVCGEKNLTAKNEKHWCCQSCGFQFFQNVASAVVGIICCGDEILLARRKFEPGKGMLDLPGGFVDYRESLEQAMAREIEEELGLTDLPWCYLFSFPNQYLYAEVLYHTQDAFFFAELDSKPEIQAMDDVAEVMWIKKDDIVATQVAFESVRNGLQAYLERAN